MRSDEQRSGNCTREVLVVTMEALLALVGQPLDDLAVQALIKSERLESSTEPDLDEGESPRSYLRSPKGGFDLCHTGGRIDTLFVYVQPTQEYAAFQGKVLDGLSAQSTRSDVAARSGPAARFPDLVVRARGIDSIRTQFAHIFSTQNPWS
jgi:hypothetical protein